MLTVHFICPENYRRMMLADERAGTVAHAIVKHERIRISEYRDSSHLDL